MPSPQPQPLFERQQKDADSISRDLSSRLTTPACQELLKAFNTIHQKFDTAANDVGTDPQKTQDKEVADRLYNSIKLFKELADPQRGVELPELERILSVRTTSHSVAKKLNDLADAAINDADPKRPIFNELLNESLQRILGREKSHVGTRQGAEAAEVCSKLLFKLNPAEWIRASFDLISSDSITSLRGTPFSRPTDAQISSSKQFDDCPVFVRNFECAVKNTFPPYVAGSTPPVKFTFNVATNKFEPPATSSAAKEDAGPALLDALRALSGRNLVRLDRSAADENRVKVILGDATPDSPVAAMISLDGKPPTPVLVTGLRDGTVTFFNPSSPVSGPKGQTIPRSDPPRKISPDGDRLESTPEYQFLHFFESVFAPAELAAGCSINDLATVVKNLLHPAQHAVVDSLNAEKILEQIDLNGFPVAFNLVRVAAGLQHNIQAQKEYLKAFVERLNEPGSSTQQNHGTCGAESILRFMNLTDKGEWSRVASDLILRSRSELRKGLKISPAKDWIKLDISPGRHPLDALLQSSLMAAAAPDGYAYLNKFDKFVPIKGNGVPKDAGFSLDAMKDVLTQFSKEKGFDWVESYQLEDSILFNHLLPRSPTDCPVLAVLRWPTNTDPNGAHAVLVLPSDTTRVSISNPHGEIRGPGGVPLANGTQLGLSHGGPDRRIDDNRVGLQSMDHNTFKLYTTSILVRSEDLKSHKVKTSNWTALGTCKFALGAMLWGGAAWYGGEKAVATWQENIDYKPILSPLVDKVGVWAVDYLSGLRKPPSATSFLDENAEPNTAANTADPIPQPQAANGSSGAVAGKTEPRKQSLLPTPPRVAPEPEPTANNSSAAQPKTAPTPVKQQTAEAPYRFRLNRQATDDAFNSILLPQRPPPPPPSTAPKTKAAVYEALAKEALPALTEDLLEAQQFILNNNGRLPKQDFSSLKLIKDTFKNYQSALHLLQLSEVDDAGEPLSEDQIASKHRSRAAKIADLESKMDSWLSNPADALFLRQASPYLKMDLQSARQMIVANDAVPPQQDFSSFEELRETFERYNFSLETLRLVDVDDSGAPLGKEVMAAKEKEKAAVMNSLNARLKNWLDNPSAALERSKIEYDRDP